MNTPLMSALKKKAGVITDKLTGVTRVDNAANPLSANAQMTASMGYRNPKTKFKFADKQQTYGVPGAQ